MQGLFNWINFVCWTYRKLQKTSASCSGQSNGICRTISLSLYVKRILIWMELKDLIKEKIKKVKISGIMQQNLSQNRVKALHYTNNIYIYRS